LNAYCPHLPFQGKRRSPLPALEWSSRTFNRRERKRDRDSPFLVDAAATAEEFENERVRLERIMTQSLLMDRVSAPR
jgi:hypothetical protein